MPELRRIPIVPLSAAQAEVDRVLTICNACRYCEGFCAVFPAMTRRLSFPSADVDYLASLCHNCGACLHACQYAPPHEFAVNVPQAMARVRGESYERYAWPAAWGALYRRNGLAVSLALAASLALFLIMAATTHGALWQSVPGGNFYAVFPHGTMVALFGPVFAFAMLALAVAVGRYWRGISPGTVSAPAAGEAARDALRLKYLDGGHGQGCNEADDRYTLSRRRFHHCTFYGFMLCFAATCVATLYHYLGGWPAPYAMGSLPKLLGVPGGVLLAIGTAGLWRLNLRRDPAQGDVAQRPMDRGFMALLFLTAVSGLALVLMRGTPAVSLTLCLHLGAVMALFLTLPYGKFVHGVFRVAALLEWSIEKRMPSSVKLTE